ncbi:Uncharacterised protein [Klebsiella pneumoniae]|uniref:Uncharacterized protein n=1 Tax=Klebsiella pneumoniae TaxID=573 RepID=A0A3S4GC41_KLEPN|nr:Uncharacterised protein [Klebsiella pneumoniae]
MLPSGIATGASQGTTTGKITRRGDKLIYLIRGNWAQKNGYVKAGPAGYLDEITQPGEEVFCRCYVTYLYNLRSIPEDMLTQKGRKFLESMKAA